AEIAAKGTGLAGGATATASRFDPERELEDLRRLIARVEEESGDQREEEALRARAKAAMKRHGADASEATVWLARARDRWVRERIAAQARDGARSRGWPNVYAMTKSLAEALIAKRRGAVPVLVARPTIVECALAFPIPGWKEGLETSGPLTWAMAEGP